MHAVWCSSRNCSRREIRNTTRSLSKIFIFVIVAVKMASAKSFAETFGPLASVALLEEMAPGQIVLEQDAIGDCRSAPPLCGLSTLQP